MFSVIIPLYNKSKYINRAIDSVLAQSYKDLELIVVDDGSTDDGKEKVEEYGDFVKLVSQENNGVSIARNNGIKSASKNYIAFLDADDYWHPNYLQTIRNGIINYPNAGIWGTSYGFGNLTLYTGSGEFEVVQDYFKIAIHNTLFFTSAVVVKKDFFDLHQGFNSQLKRGEDLDLWFRIIAYYGQGAYCDDRLVWYEHGDSTSATKSDFPIQQSLVGNILKDNYLDNVIFDSSYFKSQFKDFCFKYVLFNIYPYLMNPKNDNAISKILNKVGERYILISFWYQLPKSFVKSLFANKMFNSFFRNYMKFCFRYIYN